MRTITGVVGVSLSDLRGLQRMLNEWDPIGARPELGGPNDEFSCLYAPLLGRLANGDAAEIALFLRTELEGHFGLDANYSEPEAFAARLVDWFANGAPAWSASPHAFAHSARWRFTIRGPGSPTGRLVRRDGYAGVEGGAWH